TVHSRHCHLCYPPRPLPAQASPPFPTRRSSDLGSGKSTLLHVLAGLDEVDRGTIQLDGTEITALGDDALTRLRRERIGFVFQSRSEEHTSELQSRFELVCRLLLEKKKAAKEQQV